MAPAPPKNRRWIWYFVVVFALAIAASAVLITFNLKQQLKPEQLQAARKLWAEKGPANYTMSYTTTRVNTPVARQAPKIPWALVVLGLTCLVSVAFLFMMGAKRGARIALVLVAGGSLLACLGWSAGLNATPQEMKDEYWIKVRAGSVVEAKFNGQPLTERLNYHGMEGLFDDMERFMKIDSAKDSPRTYVRGIFDDQKTGAVRWYVRSVMGQRQRVEITVETFTIDEP